MDSANFTPRNAHPEKGDIMLKGRSKSIIVSLTALVVALGGAGIAATGGNFILGRFNTATTPSSLSAA